MFIEERLLDKVAYGTQAGIEYRTEVKTLKSGVELRARLWSLPLARFSVIYRNLRPEDREIVVRAFRACGGRHLAFRFRDPLDCEAANESLGTATGAPQTLQLSKSYQFGPVTETAPIIKPTTVQVFADGTPVEASVDLTTGQVQLSAPTGAALTWSGTFDKPVRFDSDQLTWSVEAREGWTGNRIASADITLTEVRQ